MNARPIVKASMIGAAGGLGAGLGLVASDGNNLIGVIVSAVVSALAAWVLRRVG